MVRNGGGLDVFRRILPPFLFSCKGGPFLHVLRRQCARLRAGRLVSSPFPFSNSPFPFPPLFQLDFFFFLLFHAVVKDAEGNLWVRSGTTRAVGCSLSFRKCLLFIGDPQGRVVGFEDGEIVSLTNPPFSSSSFVSSIRNSSDREGQKKWIGGEGGLRRFSLGI